MEVNTKNITKNVGTIIRLYSAILSNKGTFVLFFLSDPLFWERKSLKENKVHT